MRPAQMNAGFSVIELLFSTLVVVVLYAVVFAPSAEQVRRKRFADCAERMRKVHLALGIYANDHDDAFPTLPTATTSEPVLGLLVPKCTSDTSIFACPGSGREVPAQGKAFADGRISYAYAMDLKRKDAPTTPLLSDAQVVSKSRPLNTFSTDGKGAGNNHNGHGGNVLFIDGHVEMVEPSRTLSLPDHAVWLNSKLG